MPSASHKTTVKAGQIVADTYEIARLVGSGGMGSVWEATHRRLPGKRVAVKILHGHIASDGEALARFRREAEIACRLGHPNIVEVHDFNFLEDGSPYLILELLEGQSLDERLRAGPMKMEDTQSLLDEVASALTCAHQQNVVHRDLKPQNIFLLSAQSGVRAKLLDFGISKIRGSLTVETQESTLLGTPQYMAPEQATGQHASIDARTDLFSLAGIAYEMLAGRPAFSGESIPEVVYKVVHVDPIPLSALCPDLPEACARAVMKGLEKKQNDRFDSVAAFVAALRGKAPLPGREQRLEMAHTLDSAENVSTESELDARKRQLEVAHTLDSAKRERPEAGAQKPQLELAHTLDSAKRESPEESSSRPQAPPASEAQPPRSVPLADSRRLGPVALLVLAIACASGIAAFYTLRAERGDSSNSSRAAMARSSSRSQLESDAAPASPRTSAAPRALSLDASAEGPIASRVVAEARDSSRAAGAGGHRGRREPRRPARDHSGGARRNAGREPSPRLNTLLAQTQKQLRSGDFARARMSARRANRQEPSARGYLFYAIASCGLGDLQAANDVRHHLPRRLDLELRKRCRRLGTRLPRRRRRSR